MYTESHGDESALTAEKPLVFSKVTDPEFKKILITTTTICIFWTPQKRSVSAAPKRCVRQKRRVFGRCRNSGALRPATRFT